MAFPCGLLPAYCFAKTSLVRTLRCMCARPRPSRPPARRPAPSPPPPPVLERAIRCPSQVEQHLRAALAQQPLLSSLERGHAARRGATPEPRRAAAPRACAR